MHPQTSRFGSLASNFGYLWVAACLALGACATAGAGGPRVSSDFTDRDEVLFDDGVDFITSALNLDGRWRDEWIAELRGRIDRADVISRVNVLAMRTDVGPQGERTYRFQVEENSTLKGGGLPDADLILSSTPDRRGYRTVEAHPQAVESGEFLVFLKWAEDDDTGRIVTRWHLAPDSDDVRAVVKNLLRSNSNAAPSKTVTVHTSKE